MFVHDFTPSFRRSSLALIFVASTALAAQAPATGAPADRWPQFRGSPALLGTSAATVPDKLRVLWTYEAGEAVESVDSDPVRLALLAETEGFLEEGSLELRAGLVNLVEPTHNLDVV